MRCACARRDDHSSRPRIASRLEQPTRGSRQLALASMLRAGWASPPLLFGLAPRGVCRAPDVAIRAVGSYPTFSPLPNDADQNRRAIGFPLACRRGLCVTGGLIFCGTFRDRTIVLQRKRSPLALPGALPLTLRILRAAGSGPTLLRAEDHGSPDFPPVYFPCEKQTGDHPTHPLDRL